MLNIKSLAALGATALVVGLSVGGWLGYRVAAGGYEKRLHADAVEYAKGWQSALEVADKHAAAERQRAVSAATRRANKARAVQEVIHETHTDIGPADCELRDSQRLRIRRIYAAYGAATEAAAAGVPDTVRSAPGAGSAARGLGTGSHSLGLRVPAAARGLRGGLD